MGTAHAVWWNEGWKSSHFSGTPGMFWERRWGLLKEDPYRWWNLGPSLWPWEQKAVHGIPPLGITSAERIQNTSLGCKGHVNCFWNSERVVFADFLEKETTVNSQRYIETLTALRRIERIGIRNETLLQHYNARPHTSAATRDAIKHLDFSVLPHPPYSPVLAPSDFHLFPKLKKHLKGQRFSCDEEVKSAVKKWFQKQYIFFKNGFKKLVQRWRKCIEVQCVVILWKNNNAALKIIDVGIFLFLFH